MVAWVERESLVENCSVRMILPMSPVTWPCALDGCLDSSTSRCLSSLVNFVHMPHVDVFSMIESVHLRFRLRLRPVRLLTMWIVV